MKPKWHCELCDTNLEFRQSVAKVFVSVDDSHSSCSIETYHGSKNNFEKFGRTTTLDGKKLKDTEVMGRDQRTSYISGQSIPLLASLWKLLLSFDCTLPGIKKLIVNYFS